MIANNEVKVWDPFARVCHWALAAAVAIAYFNEDGAWLRLHMWAAYTIIALLAFRLIWGFIGPRHARFPDFVTFPNAVLSFIKDGARLKAKPYSGHNPAGAWMIILLVVMLSLISLSGVMLYGAGQHAGPVAGMMAGTSVMWEDALKETHGMLASLTLGLIVFHMAGVIVESLIYKENLVRAMFTGRKRPLKVNEPALSAARSSPSPRARAPGSILAAAAAILLVWVMLGAETALADDDLIKGNGLSSVAPLEPVLAEAKARQAGRVIAVEFERYQGKAAYEIEILDSQGQVWELMFDAMTGEFLGKFEE